MDYTSILLRPVVTEKATNLREDANQVAFYVAQSANKIEIAKAVEKAFSVSVTKVRVITRKPSKARKNRRVIHVTGNRKAYVTLAENDKIEFFEGV